jgi:photosystem II stability/assembly factor-like uncharacterized protein
MDLCLATDGGVLIARQEGDAWEIAQSALEGKQVTTVSSGADAIIAGTGDGIYRSHDGGATWHESSNGLQQRHVRWIAIHPEVSGLQLAGTEPAALFLSTDGGASWRERPEVSEMRRRFGWYLPYSPEAGCIRGLAWHGQRAYAAAEDGGLLSSDDHGTTWHLVDGSPGRPLHDPQHGMVHSDTHSVAIHPHSADLVFVPTGGGLFRSADGGKKWMNLYRCYCRAVWLDHQDSQHFLFGPADGVDRNGRLEETWDGGKTWQGTNAGLDTPWPRHMVERLIPLGSHLFAVLSNGEVIVSLVGRWQWRPVLTGAGRINDVSALP